MTRTSRDTLGPTVAPGAAFLASLGEDPSLFTLGASVAKIIQIGSDGDEAVSELTYLVLSDAALTQKILRLANTPAYRPRSGAAITTVSRAIFSLGFETVRLSALALVLVNGIHDKKQAQSVARELSLALRSSVMARKLAASGPHKRDETVAIAALFKNFGALLLASHGHELYQRVRSQVASGSSTLSQACHEAIGCSFDSLAEQAMRQWQIPDPILRAATRPAPRASAPGPSDEDWRLQAAAFSMEAAKILPAFADGAPADFGQELLARFGPALGLDPRSFRSLMESAKREAGSLESGFEFDSLEDLSSRGHASDSLLAELSMPEASLGLAPVGLHPSGKPLNSLDLLMSAAQEGSSLLAAPGAKPGEFILFLLEALSSSMGFRFAAFCMLDPQTGAHRARASIGERRSIVQPAFQFTPGSAASDIFALALEKGADLTISDARSGKIQSLMPAWHQALLPDARSFVILPLCAQGKAVGFFYADRALPAPEGVSAQEAGMLKMLKGQALSALRSRG